MKKYLIFFVFWISFGSFAQTFPSVTEKGDQKIIQYPDGRTAVISQESIQICDTTGHCQILSPEKWGNDFLAFENRGNHTVRVTQGGQRGDYKLMSADENNAVVDISSPDDPDKKARASIHSKGENEAEMVVKDTQTGRVVARAAAKKDAYLREELSLPEYNRYANVDVRRTGPSEDDISGTVKYNSDTDTLDLKIVNGQPIGTVRQIENGYEHLVTLYANGSSQLLVNDLKTHKTLYTAQGTDDHMKLYDQNGKLIAEGSEENMKVYDKSAYKHYQKITDED